MRKLWILMVLLAVGPVEAGNLSQADAVKRAYAKSLEVWNIKMQLAKGDQERAKLMESHPKPEMAARRMWTVISGQLNEEWTIEPAAWFLRMTTKLVEIGDDGLPRPAMREEMGLVQDAVVRAHLKSRKLAPMCMALVACGDNSSLNILRRIEKENPDKKVAGVAALGLAMMAKNIGDDPRLMRERLSMLRKAIIDAADVKVDGVSVAKLAEEELYIIMNLSKGQKAPELVGVDSGGRPLSLASYAGKVVVLLFWNSGGEDTDAVIKWARAMRADPRFAGKPFEVIGVNSDPRLELRKLQADGGVDWPNFSDPENTLGQSYRVGAWPLTYVLGPDRKIHYVGTTGTFAELTAAAVLDGE